MKNQFIFLVQHGEAVGKEINPERPLSDKGRENVKKVGHFLYNYGCHVDSIWHSPKLRARETAKILGECLKKSECLYEFKELEPEKSPKKIMKYIQKEAKQNIMIVGHLPHLSHLTGLLLCGDENKEIIAFEKGGVICIETNSGNFNVLRWIIVPTMVM